MVALIITPGSKYPSRPAGYATRKNEKREMKINNIIGSF
jgi:hypothetical protein